MNPVNLSTEETTIMPINSIEDLLVDELRDLLDAEKQLVKALGKMAKAASDDELRTAFESHRTDTEQHVVRLGTALESLGQTVRAKTCKAMQGLVKEGQEMIEEAGDAPEALADAALIGAAQKVEHYEIAGYGTARALAEIAGEGDVLELLLLTLDEEKQADEKLTQICQRLLRDFWGSESEMQIETEGSQRAKAASR
jgi:ferritin-like metal-binding protein YciE